MATLDDTIQVSIVTDAPPVGRAGFGVMVVVDDMTFTGGERIKAYSDSDAAAEDDDLTEYQQDAIQSAFSQTPRPAQVKAASYDELEDDDYGEALDAIVSEDSDFYAVAVGERQDKGVQKDVADWCLANERLALIQTGHADVVDPQTSNDVISELADESNDRVKVLAYMKDDKEPAVEAWASQKLAVDPDQATTTWKYATLAGIPTDDLTTTEKNTILDKGGNVYLPFFGQGATSPGRLADGTFTDVRITSDWCLARTREAFAQRMLDYSNRGSKIPYTDEGFEVFEQATFDVLLTGEDVGHFIEDTSYVNMPERVDVPQADVDNRILRFDFGAAIAGSVHDLNVDGTLSADLDIIEQLSDN